MAFSRLVTVESLDVYIFYFDLVGVVDQFLKNQNDTLTRLRDFHSRARGWFPFSGPHSALKTLADNVWARINVDDGHIAGDQVLELASRTMAAARDCGFREFFGVITRGEHSFDLVDRALTATIDPTDILLQHIDMTSEPHVRAALAEKWSAHLARQQKNPIPVPSVWVSEEVFDDPIEESLFGLTLPFTLRPERFDLKMHPDSKGRMWPFAQSKFSAIVPR